MTQQPPLENIQEQTAQEENDDDDFEYNYTGLDYICFCKPICPIECVPKIRRQKQEEEEVELAEERRVTYVEEEEWGEAEVGHIEYEEEEGELEEEPECAIASTTSGNIIDRIIRDPSKKRSPCLGKWVQSLKCVNLDAEDSVNAHQYIASLQATPLDQMCCLRITSDPNPYRQPAIIATIGPSCSTVREIIQLIEAGMNIARINMAHADPCDRSAPIKNVLEACNRHRSMFGYNSSVAVMMDLKGPQIRTGKIDPVISNMLNSQGIAEPLVNEIGRIKKGIELLSLYKKLMSTSLIMF